MTLTGRLSPSESRHADDLSATEPIEAVDGGDAEWIRWFMGRVSRSDALAAGLEARPFAQQIEYKDPAHGLDINHVGCFERHCRINPLIAHAALSPHTLLTWSL